MQTEGNVWPTAENAAATILLGRWYASIRLHIVSRVAVLALISTVLSIAGLYSLTGRQPQYRYVLTDMSGTLVHQVPLREPNRNDEFIIKWAVDSATRLNTYDFANYREQFQEAKMNMTPQGWKNFEKAMQDQGVMNTVTGLRAIATAVPTGPGVIIKRGSVLWKDGFERYAWRVRFPMQLSYRSANLNENKEPIQLTTSVNADVLVIRVPEYMNPDGLGIRQLILEGK